MILVIKFHLYLFSVYYLFSGQEHSVHPDEDEERQAVRKKIEDGCGCQKKCFDGFALDIIYNYRLELQVLC